MWNAILCRYGEIALKGGNRGYFERLMGRGIRRVLHELDDLQIWRERGRIVLHRPGFEAWSPEQVEVIRRQLPKAFGLTSFSPAIRVESTVEAIEQAAVALFPEAYAEAERAHPGSQPIPFAVFARRSWKHFPLESTELAKRVADQLIPGHPRLAVDLKHPHLRLSMEVREKWSFVYSQEIAAPGGMPSGSAAPALALLSGGIDSPVACYLAMKRGVSLDFLTFHSYPYTPLDAIDKVASLVRILNGYQRPGRLYACNLAEAQKIIRDTCMESYRTIFYRRLMMRVATALGVRHSHCGIVTGESIGQVASQTLPNLQAIDETAGLVVLRPVITMDKVDITAIARELGTFDISIVPCADSCTVFMPPQPATAVKLGRVHHDESLLDLDALLAMALESTKRIDLETLEETPWDAGFHDAPIGE